MRQKHTEGFLLQRWLQSSSRYAWLTKRSKFPVYFVWTTTGWQLPDSTIPRTSSSEPCPPSTNCSTTNRLLVSRAYLLWSHLCAAPFSLPPPGGSFFISIDAPVPVSLLLLLSCK
ncbi:hypothetical protein ATANTOWER_014244 [Ataeniobius toweri]|uniref:Uncharacterized protein n=1 Tax=Ataeniobius toweri TaxID=208326 RepID=A0ABU7BQI2_9TELE|nr:hypothetical protein [Ataeniobius toweri]